MPVSVTRPHSYIRAYLHELRGVLTSRWFFSVITGWLRGFCWTRYVPDSIRLALPRPPNLESQYQSMRQTCQVKITKSGRIFS